MPHGSGTTTVQALRGRLLSALADLPLTEAELDRLAQALGIVERLERFLDASEADGTGARDGGAAALREFTDALDHPDRR